MIVANKIAGTIYSWSHISIYLKKKKMHCTKIEHLQLKSLLAAIESTTQAGFTTGRPRLKALQARKQIPEKSDQIKRRK